MNRDLVKGNWNQFKGKVMVRWSILVGDHLGVLSGKRMQSAGERQSAFGVLRSGTLRGVINTRSPVRSYSSKPSFAGNPHPKVSAMSVPTQESH